jgi:DNA-binding IclR family transcriptional regulator
MIQSVLRAHQLLLAVAERPDGTGVRELARATGLKAPTAQSLLKTLAHCGLLHFDPESRTYRVGLGILRLADSVPGLRTCADFARPWVDDLHQELGETVAAGVLEEGRLVLAYWRRPDRGMAVAPFRTVIEHPHLLASGMLLLSWQSEAARRSYAERTDPAAMGTNLPATVEEFIDETERVRAQGYAELRDAAGSGVGALGVPVRDAAGSVALALAFSTPLTRYDALRGRALQALRGAAGEMSTQLGWHELSGGDN